VQRSYLCAYFVTKEYCKKWVLKKKNRRVVLVGKRLHHVVSTPSPISNILFACHIDFSYHQDRVIEVCN